MAVSPRRALQAARPYVAERLIDAAQWETLCALAEPLPACATSVGFECRLAGAGTVDLGCNVSPGNDGAAVLAGRTGDDALTRLIADPRWPRLRDFARAWTEPGAALATRVPFLFLELDADASAETVPMPSVFLAADWTLAELADANPTSRRRGFDDLIAALGALRSAPFAADVLTAGAASFAALPDGSLLLHAGAMTGRAGEDLRLSALVRRRDVDAYAAAIGRGECRDAVASALARYGALGGFAGPEDHVQLDFDPTGADARLGVTLRPDDYRMWPLLLRLLVADGLCDDECAGGLLQWSGASLEAVLEGAPPCQVRRTIEHVKLVCAGGRIAGAKAYFGATPI